MTIQHETHTIQGYDNTQLFVQSWLPGPASTSALVLAHGIGEHSGRYAHVAEFLAGHGMAVYAVDHRGHGQSAGGRGHIEHFEEYVDDFELFFEFVRAQQADTPLVCLGHSMGSLIALLFTARRQDDLAALVLSGTALYIGGTNAVTRFVIKLANCIIPQWKIVPPIAPELVSRDPEVIERYTRDPLNNSGPMRPRQIVELMRGGKASANVLPQIHIPVLALHGGADQLTLIAGAERVRSHCGAADKTLKIYDGLRHEVFNEPEKETVLNDLAAWLAERGLLEWP